MRRTLSRSAAKADAPSCSEEPMVTILNEGRQCELNLCLNFFRCLLLGAFCRPGQKDKSFASNWETEQPGGPFPSKKSSKSNHCHTSKKSGRQISRAFAILTDAVPASPIIAAHPEANTSLVPNGLSHCFQSSTALDKSSRAGLLSKRDLPDHVPNSFAKKNELSFFSTIVRARLDCSPCVAVSLHLYFIFMRNFLP
jgi:hypothetical protein